VVVGSAADILARVVSAKRSLVGPTAVSVRSAFLLDAFVSDAETMSIFAFVDVGGARSVANTFLLVASVGRLLAKLVRRAHVVGSTFDVFAFLFDAFVSLKASVVEEVSAVLVASAFLFDAFTRFAEFFV